MIVIENSAVKTFKEEMQLGRSSCLRASEVLAQSFAPVISTIKKSAAQEPVREVQNVSMCMKRSLTMNLRSGRPLHVPHHRRPRAKVRREKARAISNTERLLRFRLVGHHRRRRLRLRGRSLS